MTDEQTTTGPAPELVGSGWVLESPDHGPQLCLGFLMTSNPPQGSGPDITNWDWASVTGHETLDGTTWGDYTVVGTCARGVFTLTRPPVARPVAPVSEVPDVDPHDFDDDPGPTASPVSDVAPCVPPPGGWRVVDHATTTAEAMEDTLHAASLLPGFVDSWLEDLDTSLDGELDDSGEPLDAGRLPEPDQAVLHVVVSGDARQTEATLRRTWGGALCVTRRVGITAQRLRRIVEEVHIRPGVLTTSAGRSRVSAYVVHDDGSLQDELDGRYGPGRVHVHSALRPYRG
ncbi:hypothetical protein [Marmoricola sp. Leaf446]|uniref:hypothetical protein n=1 Tax=Marmoricola sp. Leaf446 TaxID=1736379 RepID=UPI0012E368F0|nr:hypothetical protein [Marmoricola sp. Leaf446]